MPTPSPTSPETDPLHDLIVVNGLGDLDNGFGVPPSGPGLVTSEALAAAKASGLTAVNMTLEGDSFEDAVRAIARRDEFLRRHPDDYRKIFSTEDIRQAKAQRKIGIIYGFQNTTMLGDDAELVDVFADLGIRVIQLTYNSLNRLGGGSMAPGDPGLTPFGHEVVERLNARRVVVDLSHSGRRMCLDAARASRVPICISHTGCAALNPHPRNKTDEELRVVADGGGYVGIYFMMYLTKDREATVDDVVAHLEHALDVCGEDHVGIGTDHGVVPLKDMETFRTFFAKDIQRRAELGIGAPGERPDILPFVHGLSGPEQFRNLYRALAKRGHGADRLAKIMGLNYLRYSQDVWGA